MNTVIEIILGLFIAAMLYFVPKLIEDEQELVVKILIVALSMCFTIAGLILIIATSELIKHLL